MRRGRRPKWMLKIARERINILFRLADKEFQKHPERSNRYVKLARNIATKYNIKMPQIWRRRFCKNCYLFLKPGYNCRIRLSKSCVVISCLECGNVMRIPYIKEKKNKRREKVESYTIKKRANEPSSFCNDN
ncbi:MAG: ribonuclease P [Methanobacterium sp. BRmetb2]|nr:MAG: ribonuclease P [Methanobacterium sp. BRmetb2]